MFVSGRAGYGFVEQVMDISHNRTSGDLEVGYFVTPSFRAFGIVSGQDTHGGVDFRLGACPPCRRSKARSRHHSAGALRARRRRVSYSITDSFDMFASFARLVAGRNGHVLNRGITVGASWGFSRSKSNGNTTGRDGRAQCRIRAPDRQAEGSLGRCICQKSGS